MKPKRMPKPKPAKRMAPPILSIGAKVDILSGDQSTPLGVGEYVGLSTVYCRLLHDPHGLPIGIQAAPNPEVKPDDGATDWVAMPNNPKFKLGDGFVYGCQCWWGLHRDPEPGKEAN